VTGAKNRKSLLTLVAAVLIQIFWKFFGKVVLMISRSSSKIGHVWSKTRSQKLKIDNFSLHSSGCSFDPNILEICQEGCFDDF
jgi:hypothetical protein